MSESEKPLSSLLDDPEAASMAKSLRAVPTGQVWRIIEHWAMEKLRPGEAMPDYEIAHFRGALAELRRRLSAWMSWLDGETDRLPEFDPGHACAMCGAAKIKKVYCRGGWEDKKAVCYLRLDAEGEHMHRECKECGYEWLEACPQ